MNATRLSLARLIAVLAPTLLLGGALVAQHGFGLYPCEMCLWQRWPHLAAIMLALLAIGLRKGDLSRPLVLLAALAIAVSGAIGLFHAGVEYDWWDGLTRCAAAPSGGDARDVLADIMASPIVRCDEAPWSLFGISLAGFNALFSFAAALAILALATRRTR